ncbi:hypothetical protein ACQ27_gp400 [Klebsiella phage K64-1]|nr:hypothetical protein ACQ27_gp400 [Klebsiella phage K64-1]
MDDMVIIVDNLMDIGDSVLIIMNINE